MALPTIEFPAGGSNLTLTIPLQKEDGSILDLSSSTKVELLINTFVGAVFLEGIVVDASQGICRFTLTTELLAQGTGPNGYECRGVVYTTSQRIPTKWFKLVIT